MGPLVFLDVESIGLHGPAFAVGAVAVTPESWQAYHEGASDNLAAAEFYAACDLRGWDGVKGIDPADYDWCAVNVWPALPNRTVPVPVVMRDQFWAFWREWAERGAYLVADCGWPVEARFLADCVADDPAGRKWSGPYPLLDLATLLWASGHDPKAVLPRRLSESPAHHPLLDARQSARVWGETVALLASVYQVPVGQWEVAHGR